MRTIFSVKLWAVAGFFGLASTAALAQPACPTTYLRPEPNGISTPTGERTREWPMELLFSEIKDRGEVNFAYGHGSGEDQLGIKNYMRSLQGRSWTTWTPQDWERILMTMQTVQPHLDRMYGPNSDDVRNRYAQNINAIKCYQAAAGTTTARKRGTTPLTADSAVAISRGTSNAPAGLAADTSEMKRIREAESQLGTLASQEAEEQEEQARTGQVRRIVLPSFPKCLRATDVRQDSTVKRMYWFSIENRCDQPLRLHWCEEENGGCRTTTSAADVEPGGKYTTWESRKDGRPPRLRGTACQLRYKDKPVYFSRKNQCVAFVPTNG